MLNPDLAQHLQSWGEKYRYANSCRDESVQFPRYLVTLHIVLASKQIKLSGPLAVAKIFRADDELLASCMNVNLGGLHRLTVTDWTIFISDPVLMTLAAERLRLLPKETGEYYSVFLKFPDEFSTSFMTFLPPTIAIANHRTLCVAQMGSRKSSQKLVNLRRG